MRGKLLLAIGVAAVLAAALLLLYAGFLRHSTGEERVEQPSGAAGVGSGASGKVAYLLRLEVEGAGKLLVNGTLVEVVNSTKPFTAVIEALPEACYTLTQLLVNGSPARSARLELRIGGNTTVKAVFERPLHTVLIYANAPNASVLINGSLYSLPTELGILRCDVLNITPVAPRRYMPLNSSLLYRVESDATLALLFERVEVAIELRNVLVPIRFLTRPALPINGTIITSDAELSVPLDTPIYLYPYGVDRAGCAVFNETHKVCLAGWIVNGDPIYDRYYRFNASGDLVLEQLVVYAERLVKGAWMEVFTPNGTVKVEVIPSKYLIIPFDGKAEYKGDGWLEIKGAYDGLTTRWAYYIQLPPWRKVRIQAEASWQEVKNPAVNIIEVVIRNDDLYFSAGYYFGPGKYIFEVDSGILTALYNLFPVPGGDNTIFDATFSQYFSCLYHMHGQWVSCGSYVATMPHKSKEDVEAGWLYVSGNGLLRLKIEVVEEG